jgi:MFS family permease
MGFGSALFVTLTGVAGFVITDTGAGMTLLVSFLVVRALMGMMTAPIYPASGRVIAHWIPWRQRATVNGLITCAAVLGMASTYVGFGFLIDTCGWPTAFLIAGGVTGALALVWTLYATNRPDEHTSVNDAERAWIAPEAHVPKAETATPAGPWYRLLTNRSLVLLTLSYATVGYFEYAAFFTMPDYLTTHVGLTDHERRVCDAIILLTMALGMPLGGYLSDRFQASVGLRRGRMLVAGGGILASALLLGAGVLSTSPVMVVVWFCLAMGAHGTCEGPSWATAIELGGRRGGTSAGIFNTGGNVLGALAPPLVPWIAKQMQAHGHDPRWGLATAGMVAFVGAILWLWIDPAERCEE